MCPKVIDSYGNVKIMSEEKYSLPMYVIMTPDFSDEERAIVTKPQEFIGDYKNAVKIMEKLRSSDEKEKYLRKYLSEQLKYKDISADNLDIIINQIMDELFMGYGMIGPMMRDEHLEEIMVNGLETPIYVVHRKHGMCVSNLKYTNPERLNELIRWMSKYAAREVNEARPLLDAHMPDGSRANVAIPPAAPYGPAITIRKFKKTPFNILQLIQLGTLSSELAAFLWLCVEGFGLGPSDIIIAGGAGSGKTTLLNALAMFIPANERIVTVEDTLELNFEFLDNWVPMEANPAVMKKYVELDAHSLIQNSLRMRPDRVIVGEVRGPEAQTLLVAMDIGLHGSMGTIHANNARDTTTRMLNEPMNVPVRMIPLLDLMIVANRIYDRQRGMIRRITQVSEVTGLEGDMVQLGDIFAWDMNADKIKRTKYPILLLDKLAVKCGRSKKRLNTEIYLRKKILDYLLKRRITSNEDVITYFQRYHKNPQSVITELKKYMDTKEK